MMIGVDPGTPYLWDLVAYVMTQFPVFMDAGLAGYFQSSLLVPIPLPVPVPGFPSEAVGFIGSMISIRGDSGEAEAALRGFNETLHRRWPNGTYFYANSSRWGSFLEWFETSYDTQEAGDARLLSSWMLGKEDVTEADPEVLKEALRIPATVAGGLVPHLIGGKGVAEAKPRGGNNAVNPAWRRAYNHLGELTLTRHPNPLSGWTAMGVPLAEANYLVNQL